MDVAQNSPSPVGWTAKLASHIPPGQLLRYLVVGAWNTLFGYGCYAALTALLDPVIPHGYIVASLVAAPINISVSFLGYKWFVFKTKGNYLREWLRVILVYSSSILIGTACLPVLVFVIRHYSRWDRGAPYIAGALLMGGTVVYSFLAHKKFSFRTEKRPL